MKSMLRPRGLFCLIFLFVTVKRLAGQPKKSEVHDTGDDVKLKFRRSAGRRHAPVLAAAGLGPPAAACGRADMSAEPAVLAAGSVQV
jgi:hypothetical protein